MALRHSISDITRSLVPTATASALVLLAAPLASAQSTRSLGMPGPLERLVESLMGLKEQCIEQSREAAGTIFLGLATIHLLWVAQQSLLRGGDLSSGIGGFVEQLIVMSLFAVVTHEGPQWGQDIIDFLRALGRRISGSPYVPQTLFDMSVELFMKNVSILHFGPNIMYAASLFLSCTIAAILFLAQLEATLVLSVGSVVLGFGGAVWTRSLATKYFQMSLSSGLRLMLLEVLQGFSVRHLGDAMKLALQGGTKALEATATLVGAELFTVLLMLILPLVFHALSSGTISSSVESMFSRVPMMLAGGGLASAAMAAVKGGAVAGAAGASVRRAGVGVAGGVHGAGDVVGMAGGGTAAAGRTPGGPVPANAAAKRSPGDWRRSSAGDDQDAGLESKRGPKRDTRVQAGGAERAGTSPAHSARLPTSWRGSAHTQEGRAEAGSPHGTRGAATQGPERDAPVGEVALGHSAASIARPMNVGFDAAPSRTEESGTAVRGEASVSQHGSQSPSASSPDALASTPSLGPHFQRADGGPGLSAEAPRYTPSQSIAATSRTGASNAEASSVAAPVHGSAHSAATPGVPASLPTTAAIDARPTAPTEAAGSVPSSALMNAVPGAAAPPDRAPRTAGSLRGRRRLSGAAASAAEALLEAPSEGATK